MHHLQSSLGDSVMALKRANRATTKNRSCSLWNAAQSTKAVKNNALLTSCLGKKQNTSPSDTFTDSGALMTPSRWWIMDGSAGTNCSCPKAASPVLPCHPTEGAAPPRASQHTTAIRNSAGPTFAAPLSPGSPQRWAAPGARQASFHSAPANAAHTAGHFPLRFFPNSLHFRLYILDFDLLL